VTPALAHHGDVYTAAFSPDGTRVVTASADQTARVWDASTGKPLSPPLLHEDQVVSAAFSPDGTRVVTASEDKTARVWEAATGKSLSPPLDHQGGVRCAVFSPDGTRVVTGSDDNAAHVWEVPLDNQTLAQWSAIAERGPYLLRDGVLSLRPPSVSPSSGD
jgi:WD40 repeat protein